MKCPACKSLMIVVEHEKIELDWCPRCSGVWFDRGELELLCDAMQVEENAFALDDIFSRPEPKTAEKRRHCPICGKKMRKVTLGHAPEVLVDACGRGDGLWFDKGEVVRLISQAAPAAGTDSHGRIVTFLGEVFQLQDSSGS